MTYNCSDPINHSPYQGSSSLYSPIFGWNDGNPSRCSNAPEDDVTYDDTVTVDQRFDNLMDSFKNRVGSNEIATSLPVNRPPAPPPPPSSPPTSRASTPSPSTTSPHPSSALFDPTSGIGTRFIDEKQYGSPIVKNNIEKLNFKDVIIKGRSGNLGSEDEQQKIKSTNNISNSKGIKKKIVRPTIPSLSREASFGGGTSPDDRERPIRRILSHKELKALAQSHYHRDLRSESLFSLGRAIDFGMINPYRNDAPDKFLAKIKSSKVKGFSGAAWQNRTQMKVGESIGLKTPNVKWAGTRGVLPPILSESIECNALEEESQTLGEQNSMEAESEIDKQPIFSTQQSRKSTKLLALLSTRDGLHPPTPNLVDLIEVERKLASRERFDTADSRAPLTIEEETKLIQAHLWTGLDQTVQPYIRAGAWQRSLGYYDKESDTPDKEKKFLLRKRLEYWDLIESQYRNMLEDYERLDKSSKGDLGNSNEVGSEQWQFHQLRQIRLDLRRTSLEGYDYIIRPFAQLMMERILWVWSVQHPSCGYVQGQNDLLSIFLTVFLSSICPHLLGFKGRAPQYMDVSLINACEADVYWAFNDVITALRDNYDPGLKGILRMTDQLEDISRRSLPKLVQHLDDKGVSFLQFAVRWNINLLARELPMSCIMRLWDTYMAEGTENIASFHIFVCSIFLAHWSSQLMELDDFQTIIIFLQDLPTELWTHSQMEQLLSEAFVLHNLYVNTPHHWERRVLTQG